MKLLLSFLCFCAAGFSAEKVDIVCNFCLDEHYPVDKIAEETGFQIRSFYFNYNDFDQYLTKFYSDDVKKVIVMIDAKISREEIFKIPFEKRILFIWEPRVPSEDYCELFSRVYSFNDDLTDQVRHFRFFYPQMKQMYENIPGYQEKKFCVMISQSYTRKREAMIRFFENKPAEDFDYFGCTPIVSTARYRGRIPLGGANCSHPYGDDKLSVLKNYRFCICFENSQINGYLTEKIFGCFGAGCVPVYYGAPNIEKYIPKECFIDYRDFQSDEELYQFLKIMPEDTYDQYISNIRKFLESEQAQIFTPQYLCKTIKEIK